MNLKSRPRNKQRSLLNFALFLVLAYSSVITDSYSKQLAIKDNSKGTTWVGVSYASIKPKYVLNGTPVNSITDVPVANMGIIYRLTDATSIGGSVFGIAMARSKDIANQMGSTTNGKGFGLFISHLYNPNLLFYGSFSSSETRTKVERSVPASGQSSYRGPSLAALLGGAFFFPIIKDHIATIKVQYSNNQSRSTNYSLDGADPLNPTNSLFPGSKAYLQDVSVSTRLTSHSFQSVQPYIEWRGSWVTYHSNNLQGVPFRMGNDITLGADIPLTDVISFAPQVVYRGLVVPGSGITITGSLQCKLM